MRLAETVRYGGGGRGRGRGAARGRGRGIGTRNKKNPFLMSPPKTTKRKAPRRGGLGGFNFTQHLKSALNGKGFYGEGYKQFKDEDASRNVSVRVDRGSKTYDDSEYSDTGKYRTGKTEYLRRKLRDVTGLKGKYIGHAMFDRNTAILTYYSPDGRKKYEKVVKNDKGDKILFRGNSTEEEIENKIVRLVMGMIETDGHRYDAVGGLGDKVVKPNYYPCTIFDEKGKCMFTINFNGNKGDCGSNVWGANDNSINFRQQLADLIAALAKNLSLGKDKMMKLKETLRSGDMGNMMNTAIKMAQTAPPSKDKESIHHILGVLFENFASQFQFNGDFSKIFEKFKSMNVTEKLNALLDLFNRKTNCLEESKYLVISILEKLINDYYPNAPPNYMSKVATKALETNSTDELIDFFFHLVPSTTNKEDDEVYRKHPQVTEMGWADMDDRSDRGAEPDVDSNTERRFGTGWADMDDRPDRGAESDEREIKGNEPRSGRPSTLFIRDRPDRAEYDSNKRADAEEREIYTELRNRFGNRWQHDYGTHLFKLFKRLKMRYGDDWKQYIDTDEDINEYVSPEPDETINKYIEPDELDAIFKKYSSKEKPFSSQRDYWSKPIPKSIKETRETFLRNLNMPSNNIVKIRYDNDLFPKEKGSYPLVPYERKESAQNATRKKPTNPTIMTMKSYGPINRRNDTPSSYLSDHDFSFIGAPVIGMRGNPMIDGAHSLVAAPRGTSSDISPNANEFANLTPEQLIKRILYRINRKQAKFNRSDIDIDQLRSDILTDSSTDEIAMNKLYSLSQLLQKQFENENNLQEIKQKIEELYGEIQESSGESSGGIVGAITSFGKAVGKAVGYP